ncbi:HTH_Tnp_Tc3_2 domain-containing protein [Trichonephila clavipes]|nr:HTH_Tnp_Tc3_2 domain-containing protein [Trichonephila clavipes]
MSFTRRPVSGRPRQTSRPEDRHIIRNASVQPTDSSAAVQAQVTPSLRGNTGSTYVSFRTIRRRLLKGHLGSRCPLRVLPLTPTHRLKWCHARAFLGLPDSQICLHYLGSFGMENGASHEFERTTGKVTANMERNISRHHTELVCLNARSYRIVHSC